MLDRAAGQPLAHLAIGQAVWPHHDVLDSPGGREAAVRDITRTLALAADRGRVDALLPGVAALTNTDANTIRTVLDRQRQGSGARTQDVSPDGREDRGDGETPAPPSRAARG